MASLAPAATNSYRPSGRILPPLSRFRIGILKENAREEFPKEHKELASANMKEKTAAISERGLPLRVKLFERLSRQAAIDVEKAEKAINGAMKSCNDDPNTFLASLPHRIEQLGTVYQKLPLDMKTHYAKEFERVNHAYNYIKELQQDYEEIYSSKHSPTTQKLDDPTS